MIISVLLGLVYVKYHKLKSNHFQVGLISGISLSEESLTVREVVMYYSVYGHWSEQIRGNCGALFYATVDWVWMLQDWQIEFYWDTNQDLRLNFICRFPVRLRVNTDQVKAQNIKRESQQVTANPPKQRCTSYLSMSYILYTQGFAYRYISFSNQ